MFGDDDSNKDAPVGAFGAALLPTPNHRGSRILSCAVCSATSSNRQEGLFSHWGRLTLNYLD